MKQINVKVKKPFMDRYTGVKHKEGDILNVSDKRLREIKRSGDFVEVVKEAPAEVKKENK